MINYLKFRQKWNAEKKIEVINLFNDKYIETELNNTNKDILMKNQTIFINQK